MHNISSSGYNITEISSQLGQPAQPAKARELYHTVTAERKSGLSSPG